MMYFSKSSWAFLLSLQLLLLLLCEVATVVSSGDVDSCVVRVTEDISLGINPNDAFGGPTMSDFYSCNSDNQKNPPPLLVFATGGPATRKLYTMAATNFAQRGYAVMVVDHLLFFGSVVYAWDLNEALLYAVDNFNVDEERIAFVGHSQGHIGVLWALSEQCPPPFCGPSPLTVPLDPRVKAAAGYSGIVYNKFAGGFDETINNAGFPYLFLVGGGDEVTFRTDAATNENIYQGSYDRQTPTKVTALIDNMDHHSIADVLLSPRDDILSTLPRDDQVNTAVDVLDFWIQKQFKNNQPDNFCNQLTERGEEGGDRMLLRNEDDRRLFSEDPAYVVTDCQEAYAL